jgi:ABC-2 type transport system ATP-binding protein
MPPAIILKGVTKRFRKNKKEFTAVDNISLEIPRGKIFGLLGPNGAGKTTTISMICTLLTPTKGKILLEGIDVTKDTLEARKRIGLVFQETTLDLELTGRQNLDFHARLFKIDNRKRKVDEALELVGLTKDADVTVRQYSGGMKRRLEISRAIIHEPAMILLDEPTLGLDPVSRRGIWEYINMLIERKNVTVLLTTHYLEEAERLCSRIAIIDKGKVVVQGTPEALKAKIGNDIIILSLKRDDPKLAARLREMKGVKRVVRENGDLFLYVKDVDKTIVPLMKLFSEAQVSGLQIKRPSLDDVFFHYTGHKYEDAAEPERKVNA